MAYIPNKHYIIDYKDIANLPFQSIDSDKLIIVDNKLTTKYNDTILIAGNNIYISEDGHINVVDTFSHNNDSTAIYYNGNVGIGITNPTSLFHIYDNINDSNLLRVTNNGLLLETNIMAYKTNIEIGTSNSKINKIYCNLLNDIDVETLLNLDDRINTILDDTLANSQNSTNSSNYSYELSQNSSNYSSELFQNSSNYSSELFQNSSNYSSELFQNSSNYSSELFQNSSNYSSELFQNSSNYSSELFVNSSNYSSELFVNSSNYSSELFVNSSNYTKAQIEALETFNDIKTSLPSLQITGGNDSHQSAGIILNTKNNVNTKSYIILKSSNDTTSNYVQLYNYDTTTDKGNLLISTNNNNINNPTVILNKEKMILGYNIEEYFQNTYSAYTNSNILEIKGDMNIQGDISVNNKKLHNPWSLSYYNASYLSDITFKDNTFNDTSVTYQSGSLVTIIGDLEQNNKQGLIIGNTSSENMIGITNSSIKLLSDTNGNGSLTITSKGDEPVNIGNNISSNTLQIYQNEIRVKGDIRTPKITFADNSTLTTAPTGFSGNYYDLSNLPNLSGIATNTSNIATNTSNLTALNNHISTSDASFTKFFKNIELPNGDIISSNYDDADVRTLLSTNATNINTNAFNINTNADNITNNTYAIATNADNIATNAADIATNAGNIATNTSNIATNTSNLTALNNHISTSDSSFTKFFKNIELPNGDVISAGPLNGTNGTDGTDGTDGTNGTNGTNGTDGLGWVNGSYSPSTGIVTFASNDGLGFTLYI